MVANPEVCRNNGAKSKGAVTSKGKAIASRNAQKHGLLTKQPPLLVTEDFSTFEGLIQELINYYQPENPVEHFLIQQVAMGMLKQYRLWNVEAAIANLAILKQQQENNFSDVVIPPKINLDDFGYLEQRVPLKLFLLEEARILKGLIADLEHDLDCSGKQNRNDVLKAFSTTLRNNYFQKLRTATVYHYQDNLMQWLSVNLESSKQNSQTDLSEVINRVVRLSELAKQRIDEIKQLLIEIETNSQAIAKAQENSKALQNPELFARYQKEINRDLYAALDRLEALRDKRNH
ncbi:hypothetical protein [Floridanema evergladense]|uniref:Uncharacterized protein n=1 Tax=Floridaenema evergladense BLCC-F167 TaxID=3153639 RepID=A0ABV4WDU7_9CYAN